MKISESQAAALLEADPFAIVKVVAEERTGEFYAELLASNIPEWALELLLVGLTDEVDQLLDVVTDGTSVYLCQLQSATHKTSLLGASIVRLEDTYWQIIDHTLLSTEPLEAAEEA